MDIMKLAAGPERDETMKLWNARVMALKDGTAVAAAAAAQRKVDERPAGTAEVKKRLLEKLAKAKTRGALDEAANEISVYVWADPGDKEELEKRYQACVEDIDL
jgi:hypothetical protein